MMYTFDNLSPLEFTELTRDLIRAREHIDLSVSPEGRDGGIDIIRFGETVNPSVMVQCKHYKRSQKAQLIRAIKAELSKVKKINPSRYILSVSQPLTVANKNPLLKYFHPYLKSGDDILAADDLNGLLRDFPAVQAQHYKLWLHSAAVLQHMLAVGSGVWQSQLQREIQDRMKIYVQTPSFNLALDILERHRLVIISGSPGIGKSTLAQMLIAKHLESGFIYHEIESFDDNPKHIPATGNVIVYFDDFLGKSVWRDNASPETEKRLEKWLDLVERDPRLRLILTTRSYLLESARRFSDVGSRKVIKAEGVELILSEFSRSTRARILYNHLYFHSVDYLHCRSLAQNGVLERILKHPNFVPRIIETISKSSDWPKSLSPDNYANHILKTLDNPDSIYLPAIQDRISLTAKEILFVLGTWTSEYPSVEAIQKEHGDLMGAMGKQVATRRDFDSGLKELTGSLVELYQDIKKEERCRFLNPGVGDSTRKAMWAENNYWDGLVKASSSGLLLYALALCVPGISNFPGDNSVIQMPDHWFDRWAELAKSDDVNVTELLEGLSECFSLNIWSAQSSGLELILEPLFNRYQEGFGYEPDWSILAVNHARPNVISDLNRLPWFEEAFVTGIQTAIASMDFEEASQRFSSLTKMGVVGIRAWSHLRAKAETHFEDLVSETHFDEQLGSVLYDDEWEELDQLIKEYGLSHLQEKLKAVPSEPRPVTPSSPPIRRTAEVSGELSDAEIRTMFASLADLPSTAMEKSLRSAPF